jgi:hypothetical protein
MRIALRAAALAAVLALVVRRDQAAGAFGPAQHPLINNRAFRPANSLTPGNDFLAASRRSTVIERAASMRPALISLSASLCMASRSFRVGGILCADLTMNMKPFENSSCGEPRRHRR